MSNKLVHLQPGYDTFKTFALRRGLVYEEPDNTQARHRNLMHNPFKSLDKNPILSASLKKRAKKAERVQAEQDHKADEEDEFLRAMAGVQPLQSGGREIAVSACHRSRPAPAAPKTFARLLEENVEFELEYTHEFMQAQIRGLDAKIFRKLKAGEFSIEKHLDLHGLNAEQAKLAVLDFTRSSYMEGRRCVLLIPGRGRNSPLGQGILRQEVSTWLTQAPLKRIVLAFATALPKHGGSGAIYLLLRQMRKDRGKLIWDDIFTDLEG